MRVAPEIYDTADDVGTAAALEIADGIESAATQGRTFVLGCPTGRSPKTTYQQLALQIAVRGLDLRHVIIALMDEYVVLDNDGLHTVDPHLPHSCVGFGHREIIGPLNAAARPEHGIPEQNLWYPQVHATAGEYDRALKEIGGVDIFLLASGASDGHIALNPAGAPSNTVTRVVEIGEATRLDNLGTWPNLDRYDDTPRFGVTVGIATIRDLSKEVIMVVTGSHKQSTVKRLASADTYDPDWPATVLSQCARARFLVDHSAATLLQTAR